MGKDRYSERKNLCRYDLSKKFFDEIGINILDVTPLRKLFMLTTEDGKKLLKKVDYNEDKINFIGRAIEYVHDDFKNIMSMNKLNKDKEFINWNGENYILMDLIEGREASINNPLELEMCIDAVAKLHKASYGITNYLNTKNTMCIYGEDLFNYYKEAEEDLLDIKRWVKLYNYKNQFDELFIETCDEYIFELSKARDMLWISEYEKLIEDDKFISLCHNDLANHNFIINDSGVNIIDLDYSTVDLRALDIADFILKWIKNSAFSIEKCKKIIDTYNKTIQLTEAEYKLIYIFMSFPRDIYSIIKSYYHKNKEWDEEIFLHRFKTKLENDIFRIKFLNDYKMLYEEELSK